MSHYSLLNLFRALSVVQEEWSAKHKGYPEHERYGSSLAYLIEDIRCELLAEERAGDTGAEIK